MNYIKTSEVVRLPYPLQMKSSGPPSYFIKRESWGWTDFLMNPMVCTSSTQREKYATVPNIAVLWNKESKNNSQNMCVIYFSEVVGFWCW